MRSGLKPFVLILAAAAVAMMAPAAAFAHSTPEALADASKRLKKPLAVMQAVDAVGIWRGVGARERFDSVVRAEFIANGVTYTPSASGEWAKHTVKSMNFMVDYSLPASRVDTVYSDGGADRRVIEVVREKYAWNETDLGVGATTTTEPAQDRLNDITVLPHAFMRAVALAPNKDVKVSRQGGKTIISLAMAGGVGKATIGKGYFAERIEVPVTTSALGKTTLVGVYSGYKDWDGYEVKFPDHITLTLGGKPLADLTVTKHAVGGYLVWPVPANVFPAANTSPQAPH